MLVKSFVIDLATRAAHTFWQTFSAALAVLWASSGLHVTDLVHVSAWHKLAVAVIAAASASLLSTIKTLGSGIRAAGAPAGDVPALEPVVTVAVASPAGSSAVGAAVPADPGQPAAGVEPAAAAAVSAPAA